MTMNMRGAFSSHMMVQVTHVTVSKGSYGDKNVWIDGTRTQKKISAVLRSGNKFAQFDAGTAVRAQEGGVRYSDYKSLFVHDGFPMKVTDEIIFKGKTYHVIAMDDELHFGFQGFLLEASK